MASARADAPPLTPDQRQGLDTAMRYRSLGPFGTGYNADYAVTPEHDHYRIELPLKFREVPGGSAKLALMATPLGGGRWAIDDEPQSGPLSVLPAPRTAASPPSIMAFTVQGRTEHSVIDPSLATVSSFDSDSTGSAVGVGTTQQTVEVISGKTGVHSVWQPASAGRVDVVTSGTVEGISVLQPGPKRVQVAIRRATLESHNHGVAPDQLAEFARIWSALPQTHPAATTAAKPGAPLAATPPLTAEERIQLHHAVDALRHAYDSNEVAGGLAGIDIKSLGQEVFLDKIAMGLSLSQPNGNSDMRLRLAFGNVDSRAAALVSMHDLLPRDIVLALHLVGAPADDLFAVVSKAIDAEGLKPRDLAAEFIVAIVTLPLETGLDQLSFGIGPSAWTASGVLRTADQGHAVPGGAGQGTATGDLTVKVTGLDALIQRISGEPGMRPVTPALSFLKGIGRQEGKTVTWKIVYADRKFTVNGADLSKLVPHGK